MAVMMMVVMMALEEARLDARLHAERHRVGGWWRLVLVGACLGAALGVHVQLLVGACVALAYFGAVAAQLLAPLQQRGVAVTGPATEAGRRCGCAGGHGTGVGNHGGCRCCGGGSNHRRFEVVPIAVLYVAHNAMALVRGAGGTRCAIRVSAVSRVLLLVVFVLILFFFAGR